MKTSIIFKVTLALAIASLLNSCIEDVKDKYLPKTDPKLVVFCELAAGDTAVSIYVWRSNPVSYNNPVVTNYQDDSVVDNATVTLSETSSGNKVVIPFNPYSRNYVNPSGFTIEEGKTYALNVSAPGLESVSSLTSVISGEGVTINVTPSLITEQYQNSVLLSGVIFDKANEENYYALQGTVYKTFSYNDGSSTYFNSNSSASEKVLVSDKNKDGSELSFRLKIYNGYFEYSMNQEESVIDSIVLVVSQLDVHYYNFLKTMQGQQYGNPFSEADPVYSNIVNGLGILGSTRKQVFKIPLGNIQ
jgi:hypothetical protein